MLCGCSAKHVARGHKWHFTCICFSPTRRIERDPSVSHKLACPLSIFFLETQGALLCHITSTLSPEPEMSLTMTRSGCIVLLSLCWYTVAKTGMGRGKGYGKPSAHCSSNKRGKREYDHLPCDLFESTLATLCCLPCKTRDQDLTTLLSNPRSTLAE